MSREFFIILSMFNFILILWLFYSTGISKDNFRERIRALEVGLEKLESKVERIEEKVSKLNTP